jgi:hypothetical protein
MPSDRDRLRQVFRHIERIKDGSYPATVGRDGDYQIVERPWAELPERSKLAVLQDAVDWSGISNRDQAHILLGEVDPGKISDVQRNRLIDEATRSESSQDPVGALFSEVPRHAAKEADSRDTLFGKEYGPFLGEATERALSRMNGDGERDRPEVSRDGGREI